MKTLEQIIEQRKDLIKGQGVSEKEIVDAEKELKMTFANDYRLYLKKYGAVSFDARELTGLVKVNRINVINVTKELWEKTGELYLNMYVVEDLGVDGVIILQDSKGYIYQCVYGNKADKLCDSLVEYLED